LNPNQFRKSKENERTGPDPLQQAVIQVEIMHFHDMKESDFSRLITCGSGGQQRSESVSEMYHWFVFALLLAWWQCWLTRPRGLILTLPVL
jgi:hypothetical protein